MYPIFIDGIGMSDNFDPEVMRKFVEALGNATVQVDEIVQGQKKEKEETDKKIDAVKKFTKELGNSSAQLGKAMVDASNSSGKYAAGLEGAGAAASNLGKAFGPLGAVIGGAVEMFTKLVGAGLKQNDALSKTYRSLAQIGDLDNANFKAMLGDLQKSGFAIGQNSDQYVDAIRNAAPALAAFAGSVTLGRKQLVSSYGYFKSNEAYFERLGYTAEEGFERMTKVVDMLAFSNNKKSRSDKELYDMTADYMENLSALNALTGVSRKEAEDKIKQQETDLRWQMRMQDFKDEEQIHLKQAVAALASIDPNLAEGFKSQMANFGGSFDKAAIYVDRFYGKNAFFELEKAAKGGNMVELFEVLKKYTPAAKENYEQFRGAAAVGKTTQDKLQMTAEGYNSIIRLGKMNTEDIKKDLTDRKNAAKNQNMDENTLRKQNERALRSGFEDMLQSVNEFAVPALTAFTDIVRSTAKRLAEILARIGGPDYTKTFKDASDVQGDINKESKQYQKTMERINKLEKEKAALKGGTATEAKQKAINEEYDALKDQAAKILDLEEDRVRLGGDPNKRGYDEDTNTALHKRAGRPTNKKMGAAFDPANYSTANRKTIKGTGELEGLNIKEGDVHREGSGVDPRLIQAARTIQEQLPGFVQFTSFNDKHHQDKNSLHNQGKAFDFLIDHFPDEKEAKGIAATLRGLGIKLDDEYNYPSPGATGPHFHASLGAANGGYFNGPKSGYMVEQHGFEGTFNNKQLTALNNALTKTPISGGGSPTRQDDTFLDIMTRLLYVMESIETLQRRSAGSQEKLVKQGKK